jgi:hypothetical protein
MKKYLNQIAGTVNQYQLASRCTDFNHATYECCEEIYKVTYSYWYKCHRKFRSTACDADKNKAEFKFMVDIVGIIEILRPLFMVEPVKLSDTWLRRLGKIREEVKGSVPSPAYFNFLLHTAKLKVCQPGLSLSFNKFVEILFMAGLEENNITGVIPLDTSNPLEQEVYDLKLQHGINSELAISNSDIVALVLWCQG